MTDTPKNRDAVLTEQRLAASANLDTVSIADLLHLINGHDATVIEVVRGAIPAITKLVECCVDATRLIYFGAGTSGRLGVLDASECPPTFFTQPHEVVGLIAGGDTALRTSSEGAEDDTHGANESFKSLNVDSGDVVIGIAAGGTTPYVIGGLRIAGSRGATTALITCTPTTPTATDIDHIIELLTGPEVLTGSTRMKAGTATKLALNMISTTTMAQRGKTWGNLMVDLRATNDKLRDRAVRILTSQCNLTRMQAATRLDQAVGCVKLALVMAKKNVNIQRAQQLLDAHHGRLRPIIGPPV